MKTRSSAALLLFLCAFVTVRAEGLIEDVPDMHVNSMVQDARGYVWIGTDNGLFKYNGRKYTKFYCKEEDTSSLPSNRIISLALDDSGTVWIATDCGLCIYDECSDDILRIAEPGGCRGLYSCNEGIVCCAEGGLYLYDIGTRKEISVKRTDLHNIMMLVGKDGQYWGGSASGGTVVQYNESFEPVKSVTAPEASGFLTMAVAPDGSLWAGREDGLLILKDGVFIDVPETLEEVMEGNGVTELIVSGNCIYVCISMKGIVRYDFSDGSLAKGLQNKVQVNKLSRVSCGFVDKDNHLWIGTSDRGFGNEYLIRKNFNISQNLRDMTKGKYINCAACSPDGTTVWLGSVFKGILGYDVKGQWGQWYDYNKSGISLDIDAKGVSAMECASDYSLWYCAEGKTYVCQTSGNSLVHRELVSEGVEITVFCEDGNGLMWGGSGDGLFHWDNAGRESHILEGQAVSDVISYSGGEMMVSTEAGGLFLVDSREASFREYGLPEQLQGQDLSVKCMFLSSSGNLWLGTQKDGLVVIGRDSVSRYDLEDSLGPAMISDISEDRHGNIWISTVHGLSVVCAKYGHPVSFSGNELSTVQHFTSHSLASCGEYMVCGGNTGALFFRPGKIMERIAENPPMVVFAELLVNNETILASRSRGLLQKPLDDTRSIVLPHKCNNFEIVLDAINFNTSTNDRLFYRVSGRRQQGIWTECGSARRIPFFGLPRGNYTLEVISGNDEGFYSDSPRSLSIKVKTPVWLSAPLILLYMCLLAMAVWAVLSFLSRRMQERLRLENAEKDLQNEKDLSTMKLNFFGNISHELRTYLTLIYSPVNMISKAETKAERDNLIGLVNLNTTKLIELVDQLLALNRIESSALPLNVSEQNPSELISFYFSLFETSARRKGIALVQESSLDPSLRIFLDADKFGKILNNLLSNAVKYTQPDGHITVISRLQDSLDEDLGDAARSRSYLVISVRDDGIGMKPSDISGIFDRYTRLENAEFVSTGSGIGLHYTSQLVKMHKGAISARLNPDKGMTFTIAIPTDEDLYSDAISQLSLGYVNGLSTDLLEVTDSSGEMKDDIQVVETGDNPGVKILLVEDNVLLREFVKSILCPEYEVYIASDGVEALDLVEDVLPDFVITDVMMPRMDGFTLSRNIKDNPALSHIPVIILTAKTDEKDRLAGYANGADIYLTKPFSSDVLLTVIRNLISSRDRLRRRILNVSSSVEIEDTTHIGNRDRQFLGTLIQYIDDNLSDGNVDILSLSDKMCLSRSSLFRKVRSLTGMTPNAFVNSYRLNKAASLLESGDYRVSEVYEILGFKSASYFSKAFKQQFGVTPSEYLTSRHK